MSDRVCIPKTPQTKAAAKKIITDFAARSTGGNLWKGLSRAKVAAGALARIDDPDKIAQKETSLCGPSCFVRSVATDLPEAYARAIANLFEYGATLIGNRGMNHSLNPSKDLLNYVLPPTAGIDQADWIILASIRDSENWFLRYSSVGGTVSAFTLPDTMVKWFEEAGYTSVKEDTSLVSHEDLSNVADANSLLADKYKVCLLINSDMLETANQDNSSSYPDHWVVLTSPITFHQDTITVPELRDCFRDPPGPRICVTRPASSSVDKKAKVSFRVYSWGKDQPVPESGGTMWTNSFLKNYYGYVACKL
jgi:hypothetical protein